MIAVRIATTMVVAVVFATTMVAGIADAIAAAACMLGCLVLCDVGVCATLFTHVEVPA